MRFSAPIMLRLHYWQWVLKKKENVQGRLVFLGCWVTFLHAHKKIKDKSYSIQSFIKKSIHGTVHIEG